MARVAFTMAAAAMVLLSGAALVASSGTEHDPTPRFTAGVDLVSLDLCVRDASGRFVSGLSADEFVVLENGTPQRASFLVPSEAVPLTAVLMIDVSNSMHGEKLERATEAAQQFAERLGPRDRLSILAFNERTSRVLAFGDRPAPAATLSSLIRDLLSSQERAIGATALYDALLVAAGELARARGGTLPETREVIVVLSDGEDTASRVGFEEVLPALRRSGALVYSVSLRTGHRGEWLGATWPMLAVARDTGAEALGTPNLEGLPDLYGRILTEVRSLYRLAYVSSDTRRDGQWRTIVVRVQAHGVHVRTRSGYYAPRAATHP